MKKPLCPSLTYSEAIGEGFTYAKPSKQRRFKLKTINKTQHLLINAGFYLLLFQTI